MSNYSVAPIFVIRVAGVPFDHLTRLSTSRTASAARELIAKRNEFQIAKSGLETLLRTRAHGLTEDQFRAWRSAVRSGKIPSSADALAPVFRAYVRTLREASDAESSLSQSLNDELNRARRELHDSAHAVLPPYLVFGTEGFAERLSTLVSNSDAENGALPPRNARARERERFLSLYLQRLAAKNDTFSEFGPTAWGRITRSAAPEFKIDRGIARREAFLERWTAHAVAAAINADPGAGPELMPRRNPNGRVDNGAFVFADQTGKVPLDARMKELIARCDGATPAYLLHDSSGALESLIEANVLRADFEVPAMEPRVFDRLLADITNWRPTPVRERWLGALESIMALPAQFASTPETEARTALIDEAWQQLHELGATRTETRRRFLYAASNPIAEECARSGVFTISETMTEQFARDAEPWIDLWRDTYAFVASRVAAGLRRLMATAPLTNGTIELPLFLQHCAAQKMSLQHVGPVALAHMAFQEVKAAFREHVRDREDAAEWQFSADDCHFVRRTFEFPKFHEYTYPSADLQISATSAEAVARGDYEWILSELHPPVAMLHHCFYWDCPDRAALTNALASTAFGKPNFHFGFFAADFTAHTTVRIFDALPDLTYFVAGQRGNPKWKTVPPAEAEVYIDDATEDVCLRRRGTHEYLGSFARAWLIPLGFHPFSFSRSPHMPRLRCGDVIVQRRSWTITEGETAATERTGISTDLVLDIEQLRAARDLPRYVYIRPTEQALRRSGAEGRDKDTKPVFIDFESYLSLEIFQRWLKKAGELEVTEMLPDPDHLCWEEEDGRRTFELRTLIVPRS